MLCRVLLLLLVGLVVGCDSSGPRTAHGGLLTVAVDPEVKGRGYLLHLETDSSYACPLPLDVTVDRQTGVLRVDIDDAVEETPVPPCDVLYPARADIPFSLDGDQGGLRIELRYRGETDAYQFSVGVAGVRLDPVRTTVTRLAERPVQP